jgi:hypothetical protein
MNSKQLIYNSKGIGLLLCTALLGTLTGCIGYVDRPRPENVYYAPREVTPTIIVQDDYVYYPGYEVYYSSSRRQYAYRDGNAWVSRPAPRGVSVDVLLAAPSVRMAFHDSPEHHHAAVVQEYPRNWAPPASQKVRQERQKADERDERKGNSHK